MARPSSRLVLTVEDYVAGVIGGDRAVLARAITLVESTKRDHLALAQKLCWRLIRRRSAQGARSWATKLG
jgi:putative protein kinase ArgK-like GTPase of G3E family